MLTPSYFFLLLFLAVGQWHTLRDVRLIDCTSVTNDGVAVLAALPRLRSLVMLARLFPYKVKKSVDVHASGIGLRAHILVHACML